MRRLHLFWLICFGLVSLSCGSDREVSGDVGSVADQPGIGEIVELNLSETDRIEVRRGGPVPGDLEAWLEAEVVAELTDPEQVSQLVESMEGARLIDVGAVDYDLKPPEYQVGFYRGDELLERFGYYERVSTWGEHQVPGRWVTDQWELLAVTEEIQTDAG